LKKQKCLALKCEGFKLGLLFCISSKEALLNAKRKLFFFEENVKSQHTGPKQARKKSFQGLFEESMKQITAWLFLWGVVSAWATAGASEIAIHPLNIESTPSEATTSALKRIFREQIFKTLPEAANPIDVERFFQRRGEPSCWVDNGCVVELAKAVQSKRVLLVSVVRTEPWILMSARVLDVYGIELKSIALSRHVPNLDVSEDANFAEAFSRLFVEIDFPDLLRKPVVEPKGPPKPGPDPDPGPIPTPRPISTGMSDMRMTAYAAMGVAGAGAVFSSIFTVLYANNIKEYNSIMGGQAATDPAKADEAITAMRRANDKKPYLIVGWSATGVILTTSIVLFFLSPEYQGPAVSFAPLPGGGALSLSGQF